MTARKYRKGEPLPSLHAVIDTIIEGRPLYWRDKVQTKGWMVSQRLNVLHAEWAKGVFHEAIPLTEERNEE